MTLFDLAAEAKLVSVINGKLDAFYVPPESIRKFATLLVTQILIKCDRIANAAEEKFAQTGDEHERGRANAVLECMEVIAEALNERG